MYEGERKRNYGKLSKIIKTHKEVITKYANNNGIENFRWQKSFYDRIIRNDKELCKVLNYIDTNPLNWKHDKFFKASL